MTGEDPPPAEIAHDDQHLTPQRGFGNRTTAPPTSGILNVKPNVVPRPNSLVQVISSHQFDQTLAGWPAPVRKAPVAAGDGGVGLRKRLNRRSMFSGAMPMPLSMTSNLRTAAAGSVSARETLQLDLSDLGEFHPVESRLIVLST